MDLLTGSVPLPDDWIQVAVPSTGSGDQVFDALWGGQAIMSAVPGIGRAFKLERGASSNTWWYIKNGVWTDVRHYNSSEVQMKDWWDMYRYGDESWVFAQDPVVGQPPSPQ